MRLGRKPRGGRNWEGFGADPVLQALGGAETIKGMQANGVIATIKHLVGNEQEQYRMDIIPHGLMKAISSNIDDRTLHELYAWPFAEAIRAGVGAVMTAYNDVNGSASSQNSQLINGLLKDEMGFQVRYLLSPKDCSSATSESHRSSDRGKEITQLNVLEISLALLNTSRENVD